MHHTAFVDSPESRIRLHVLFHDGRSMEFEGVLCYCLCGPWLSLLTSCGWVEFGPMPRATRWRAVGLSHIGSDGRREVVVEVLAA